MQCGGLRNDTKHYQHELIHCYQETWKCILICVMNTFACLYKTKELKVDFHQSVTKMIESYM